MEIGSLNLFKQLFHRMDVTVRLLIISRDKEFTTMVSYIDSYRFLGLSIPPHLLYPQALSEEHCVCEPDWFGCVMVLSIEVRGNYCTQ